MRLMIPRSPRTSASIALIATAVLSSGLAAQDAATVTGPVIEDGMAQVVAAFADSTAWIRHDLWVETEFDSDGNGVLDRVHVDVTRPAQTEFEGLRVPVIYESSPYYAGTGQTAMEFRWNVRQELGDDPPVRTPPPAIQQRPRRDRISNSHVNTWVPRGFAVVHSSSPGTGLSRGCPTVGGLNESLAPKAVVDWLNGRARGFTTVDGDEEVFATWSTGKVGMTGTSYNGTLPLAAATTGVDGLEAIIPVAPNTSYYHYYRSNGLVRHPGGWLGEDIDFLYDFINSGYADTRAYCNATIRDGEMAEGRDRKTGDYNDFWAGRDYGNQLDDVRAAVLMAHAFNDWNVMPEHSNRIYQALKEQGVPVQAYYHQGGHGGPPPHEMMNRWFTRYLMDVENGVEEDPRAWIVREGDERDSPTAYPDYPNPMAERVTLHPTHAGDTGSGTLTAAAEAGQGTETLVDNVSFDGATLAQAEWSNHRLLYTTPVFTEPVHLSGTATITVRASSSEEAANLSVWLVALPWTTRNPQSTDNLITRGWADLQNRSSLRASEPLEPGAFYEMTFDLQPDDQIIPAGKSIGLMIMSSDRDFTLWPHPGTEVTVDLDATSLTLPVVGGEAAYRRATGGGM